MTEKGVKEEGRWRERNQRVQIKERYKGEGDGSDISRGRLGIS